MLNVQIPTSNSQARRLATVGVVLLAVAMIAAAPARPDLIVMRGHPQQVRYFGSPSDRPVIVSSGDGGWMHVAPHLAEWLASHHYYVMGFDSKAYLASHTSDSQTLAVDDIPADYAAL